MSAYTFTVTEQRPLWVAARLAGRGARPRLTHAGGDGQELAGVGVRVGCESPGKGWRARNTAWGGECLWHTEPLFQGLCRRFTTPIANS
jgi:hypothetical protein